jgi:hypothetical protein
MAQDSDRPYSRAPLPIANELRTRSHKAKIRITLSTTRAAFDYFVLTCREDARHMRAKSTFGMFNLSGQVRQSKEGIVSQTDACLVTSLEGHSLYHSFVGKERDELILC